MQLFYNYYNILLPYLEVVKAKIGTSLLTPDVFSVSLVIEDNNYFQLGGLGSMNVYMVEGVLFMILLISSPFLLYSFANTGHEENR
jgi:hypothetical protein